MGPGMTGCCGGLGLENRVQWQCSYGDGRSQTSLRPQEIRVQSTNSVVIAIIYALGVRAQSNGSEALVIVGQSADPGPRGVREWCRRSGPIDGKVLWQPNLGKWGAAVTWAPGNLAQSRAPALGRELGDRDSGQLHQQWPVSAECVGPW